MPHLGRRIQLVAATGLLLIAGAGPAREPLGALTVHVGDEAFELDVVAAEEGIVGVGTFWTAFMSEVDGLTIGAVASEDAAGAATLTLELRNPGEFPHRCPCAFRGVSVRYVPGPGAEAGAYSTDEAEATVTGVDERPGDAFRIEGTFAGVLTSDASAAGDGAAGGTLEVRGTFAVDRLPRSE